MECCHLSKKKKKKEHLYMFVYLCINYSWKAAQESGNYGDL